MDSKILPQPFTLLIAGLFIARVGISYMTSDGLFKGDSITYFGAVVDFGLTGSMASIQPEDAERFTRGADPVELYDHLASLRDPVYIPLGWQWLHVALYGPILFFWRSLIPVILINNILFFGAGMLFFRVMRSFAGTAALCAGWIVYALFPSFFMLTSQFLAEPLFLFFLGAVIVLAEREGTEQFFLLFIAAAALCLTHVLGIVVVATVALFSALKSRYARAFGLATAAGLAAGINAVVMTNALPPNAHVVSISAAESFYCTNTLTGDRAAERYVPLTGTAYADTMLQSYRAGSLSGSTLIATAVAQNMHSPERFLHNCASKLAEYFFDIDQGPVPVRVDHREPRWMPTLRVGEHLLFYVLVIGGLVCVRGSGRGLFAVLFAVVLVVQFLLLARYRDLLPMLAYAAAFVPLSFEVMMPAHLKHHSPR